MTINNAACFLEVQKKFGIFSAYIWRFVDGKPIDDQRKTTKGIPAVTTEAKTFAEDLKKRGFKFLRPTVIYAHTLVYGMVNNRTTTCFR